MDQNEALNGQGAANTQGDQPNNNQTMESLLESESLSVELPQAGEIRKGMIASIGQSQILVSIGAKSEGVINSRELEQLTEEERAALKVGQEVSVFVIRPEDDNGNVVLSFKRAQEQMSWENVEKNIAEETVIDSKIIGFNKGGLIVGIGSLRGFVPSSQFSQTRRAQSTGDTRHTHLLYFFVRHPLGTMMRECMRNFVTHHRRECRVSARDRDNPRVNNHFSAG